MYQYKLYEASNVIMGYIQIESAYYQPNPKTPIPWTRVGSWQDPDFAAGGSDSGWGLQVTRSKNVLVYGAGFYSFFYNYNTTCSNAGAGDWCQNRIFEDDGNQNLAVYGINTVGTTNMVTRVVNGASVDVARFSDNLNGFIDTIVLYRS